MPIGGREAITFRIRYPETGVIHAERIENPLAQEDIERLPRNNFYESTEHVGGNAIVPPRPGLLEERDLTQHGHHVLQRRLVEYVPLPVDLIDDGIGEIPVGETRSVT